ncbi:MAG: hypothetical protein J6U26_06340 [Lachnospiraceae bacterium]|nr:hypothetical protein [Lachnospiraceae bacterium]
MVILVDMDDTIEHLLVPWTECLNRKYGKNVRLTDVKCWNMQVTYPDLTTEEIFSPLDEDSFWDAVTPIEGAPEALKRLMDRGHEVYIVTATPYQSVAAKMERVLFRYFPFIRWDHVIVASNKQMIRADVLVDDGYHNLLGGSYRKILMDAQCNRMYDEKKAGMFRVKDWAEAERLILEWEG